MYELISVGVEGPQGIRPELRKNIQVTIEFIFLLFMYSALYTFSERCYNLLNIYIFNIKTFKKFPWGICEHIFKYR